MRVRRLVGELAAVVLVVAGAVWVAPGLSAAGPAPTSDCRAGPVVVGWVVDGAQPWLATGVRVSGLSETCGHNKLKLQVLDGDAIELGALERSLRHVGGEATFAFDAPVPAAPVAEVSVVLSGASRS